MAVTPRSELVSDPHFQAMVQRIYTEMPDAVMPPSDERGKLWGEVEGTQQWAFCEQIAFEIISAAQAYAR